MFKLARVRQIGEKANEWNPFDFRKVLMIPQRDSKPQSQNLEATYPCI